MRVVPTADPLAELARLRRPPGPWLHLLDGAPSDARQLGWMLGQDGVVVRILRGHCVRTGYGLFDEAAAALQLPGDPAEDWPALAALLTDMSWLAGTGHLLVVSRAALLLAAAPLSELGGFVTMVREVARGRLEEGDPVPFHVVLQDDALGLAGLRARLDAVGARYDDLAGWDAEEPVAAAGMSSRSGYEGGDPRPDEVDRAVASALSTRDGVVAVRRGWEVFRGPDVARVRVYALVLADLVAAADVVAAAAAAVAGLGAACLPLPLPADERQWDLRQHALAAGSVPVWPEPELPAEPPAEFAPPVAAAAPAEPEPVPAPAPAGPPVPDPSTVDGAAAEAGPAAAGGTAPGAPGDDPAGGFELVAANLEWPFATGAIALDPVDAALVRYAGSSGRLVGLFRTWVGDPAGGWVRVVMAYVGSGSISGVETERSTIVDLAQRSGAKRCCIEIVGSSDVSDVHRWLEERSVALWRANPAARRPAAEPAGPGADPAGPDAAPVPPAPRSPTAAPPTEAGAGSGLPPDAAFQPGPGEEEPALAQVVGWAAEQLGVLGVITAWTEVGGSRALVVGLVVEGEVDQQAVRAGAAGLLGALPVPYLVESFAPSRGLPPPQLRLYRGSTRLWTRKVERAPSNRPSVLQLDTSYHAMNPDVEQVLGAVAIEDEDLDGFTLVGLDLNVTPQRGAETPGEQDAAVVAWIRDQPHALAALRAVVTGADGEFPVYSVLVDADADRPAIRRGVARAVAATGASRCGVEAFCPFERIEVFHVELYGASLNLWKSDRPPASTADSAPGDPAPADEAGRDRAGAEPAGEPV
jgi:hypothetical protein